MAAPRRRSGRRQNNTPPNPPEQVSFSIQWEGADETSIVFANNFLVQFTGLEYIIGFAQLAPPVGFGMTAQDIADLGPVTSRIIFRVGLAPDRMRELVGLLTEYQRQIDLATQGSAEELE